jgi:dienelactone hydrolase
VQRYFAWPASVKADSTELSQFSANPPSMHALRSKAYPKKRRPLILLVHGFAADWAFLAEYLASHGYLVAHVPVKGSQKYELDYEGMGMEYQVRDYEFALKTLRANSHLSFSNIVVVGFSFGGQSAALLAMRNQDIKAIISLDGGIGSEFGANLLSRHPSYRSPVALNKPLLHIYNPRDPYTNLSLVNKWPLKNSLIIPLNNVEHGHFTSFGFLYKRIPSIMGPPAPNPGHSYESIMLMVKLFSDATLKKRKLDNWLNGVLTEHDWIKASLAKQISQA